jgi:formylmethanofuran dehydrogenase subunit E
MIDDDRHAPDPPETYGLIDPKPHVAACVVTANSKCAECGESVSRRGKRVTVDLDSMQPYCARCAEGN